MYNNNIYFSSISGLLKSKDFTDSGFFYSIKVW